MTSITDERAHLFQAVSSIVGQYMARLKLLWYVVIVIGKT